MKIKKNVKFLQEGGSVDQSAQAAPQGGNPQEQIMAMAQEIVQQLGPEAAAMLAQAITQMIQGGGQPAAPEAPVYAKKGGKFVLLKRK